MNSQLAGNSDSLEPSQPDPGKKKQRNKRPPKMGVEKPQSRWKKRKKEQEDRQVLYPTTDSLMTQLKQVKNCTDLDCTGRLRNPPKSTTYYNNYTFL